MGYRLLYATLYDAAITEADMLPDPLLNLGEVAEGNDIPFKMLFYRYDTFKEGTETSGLINIIDNQLYDVSGAYDSPYEAKEVFVATPWCKTTLNIGTYQFTQDMVTNIGTDIRNVKIDFGDGNGLQSWLSGSTLTVNYTSEGTKNIRLEVEFTGDTDTRTCRSQIDIKVPEENIFERYNIMDTFGIQVAGGWVTVLPFCGDGTIHKPLIVTNGVKIPGLFAANFDRPYQDLSDFNKSPTGNRMLDDIDNAGYDLIFINWANGVASLEDNGQVVRLAIDAINARKAASGSIEKNVLIGMSMGGICAKIALREMELAGEDHETKVYISFDAPLRGANVSLGYQYLLDRLSKIRSF